MDYTSDERYKKMSDRKKDHIRMTFGAQTGASERDRRFLYEPMLSGHPVTGLEPFVFLGKTFRAPLWVSSMTGGTRLAATINRNLARACNEFGMGMGLGSCRPIIDDDDCFDDFNVRRIVGDDLPLYANLGIAQAEQMIRSGTVTKIHDLVRRLDADGLIIHVNPLQEWLQPEGDRIQDPPLLTIKRLLDEQEMKLIIKEVGQGMGPDSLKELLRLPIEAIEFAAFGGTNFTRLELMRNDKSRNEYLEPLSYIGHDAEEMVDFVNEIAGKDENIRCRQLIISGGIKSFLQGYYLIRKSWLPAVYGQASSFLKYAQEGYEPLRQYIQDQLKGLQLAYAYLRLK
jgi:isopentenyl-diphosphate delta-isomerase